MKRKTKVLLLLGEGDPAYKKSDFAHMTVDSVDVYANYLSRMIIRILRNIPCIGVYFSLGSWKKRLVKYDIII